MIKVFLLKKIRLNQLLFSSLILSCFILFGGCQPAKEIVAKEDPCLLTAIPSPSPTPSPTPVTKSSVMIILDASGSMIEEKEKIEGKLKLDLAKESIEAIINTPEVSHLEFSLTALGHASNDCNDNIEMFDEKDEKILEVLPSIKGGRFTPLADTIKRVG
ncbi:MAG: hypothetical protein AB4060_20420, partial [Crocosphaera sp.]